jgi:hypothetical protein
MPRSILQRIAGLAAMTTPDLRDRWESLFGRPAPKRASRDLLLRALAYRVQERAEGGLSKAAKKRLVRLASGNGADPNPGQPPAPRLEPGTRLVREWRGEVHQVTVLEEGFEHRGATYGSLSQVARTITGIRWSGPVFFGLRKTRSRSNGADDGP